MLKYIFLAGTLFFTVYGQLIIKARSVRFATTGGAPEYLWRMLTDPLVISGFAAAGMAALCWLLAIRQMTVSYAYPFVALSFVLVPLGAFFFFREPMSWAQTAGLVLIVAGVTIHAVAQ